MNKRKTSFFTPPYFPRGSLSSLEKTFQHTIPSKEKRSYHNHFFHALLNTLPWLLKACYFNCNSCFQLLSIKLKNEIFLLKIYNRYGELVFETNDVSKGWNGLYKGVLQNSSAFVYYCNYKLRNEKAAFKKGTILLIR